MSARCQKQKSGLQVTNLSISLNAARRIGPDPRLPDIVAAFRHFRFVPKATYAVQQIAVYSITSSARASSAV
jgi:hypothetical protein